MRLRKLSTMLSMLAIMLFVEPLFAQPRVQQDDTYCGRANQNEPLTTIMFTFEGEYPEFDFTPYFSSMGDIKELSNLKVWVRMYPEPGNPLRGNYKTGETGTNSTTDCIDLTVWDYRHPLDSPHQTVFYIGNLAHDIVSGQKYSVSIPPTMRQSMNLKNGDKYYVYITADIDAAALEYTATDGKFEPNLVGGVVSSIKVGNKSYADNECIINGYQPGNGKQEQKTRRILKERQLINIPYDGYSRFYRIPGITQTDDGALIISTDARKFHNHDVRNDFDVISRRSEDNGRVWSDELIVARGDGLDFEGNGNCKDENNTFGYGDAALAPLPTPGGMIAAFIGGEGLAQPKNGPDVFYSISVNSGRSWSEPLQIPESVFHIAGNDRKKAVVCPSPGRMYLIYNGPLAGKVLSAMYVWENGSPSCLDFVTYDFETKKWECIGWIENQSGFKGGESQFVQLSDDSFLLSVRSQDTQERRQWFKIKLDKSNFMPKINVNSTNWDNQDNCKRLTNVGEKFDLAVECNSGLLHYDNTAADGKHYLLQSLPMSQGNNQYGVSKGGSARKDVTVKYCDLTDIINGTSTQLNWSKGLNMNQGQPIGGYSALTLQTDGSVGYVGEEYPISYVPAKEKNCQNPGMDVLLSVWYMSTTLENISEGSIETPKSERVLPKPQITPGLTTFTIDGEGEFEHSTSSLPDVTVSVDESKIVIGDDEKWHIEYRVRLRKVDGEMKEWDLVDGADKTNNLKFKITDYPAKDKLEAGDIYVVYARLVATDNDNNVLEESLIEVERYTVVDPGRKIVIRVRPSTIRSSAYIIADETVVADDTEIFVQPGKKLDFKVHTPQGEKNEFLRYNLSATSFDADDLTKVDGTFKPVIYDDKTQLHIIVPTVDEYTGDTGNNNCITVYAWFEPIIGGLYTHSLASWVDEADNYTTAAKWCSDGPGSSMPENLDTYLMKYPSKADNSSEQPLKFYNNVNTNPTYIYLSVAPDRFTVDKSLIVALYRRTESGGYEPIKGENGNIIFSTVEGLNSYTFADYDAQRWFDTMGKPVRHNLKIDTGMAYADPKAGDAKVVGKMVLYVVDTLGSDEEVCSFIADQSQSVGTAITDADADYRYRVVYNMVYDTAVSIDNIAANNITIKPGSGVVTISSSLPTQVRIVNAQGLEIGSYEVCGQIEVKLPAGIYMAAGKKFMVR